MSNAKRHDNRVRKLRVARDWSQAELAKQTGLSRAGVSAIESGRLAPSVEAALALARALHCSVEELFGGYGSQAPRTFQWAWSPALVPCRYWVAEVGGQGWIFPAESDVQVAQKHDGNGAELHELATPAELAERTLVVAGCDPAAALLAQEYQRQTGFRMIVLVRSSQRAMELLDQGKVHVAGVHWASTKDSGGNAAVLQQRGLNADLTLLHVTDWDEGLAIRPDAGIRSARQVASSRLQWIGRLSGAGARRCQDQVLGDHKPPARIAHDHRGVVEAIRSGWADVGACVRLASAEGRLGFIPISKERYDLCLPTTLAADPRLLALRSVLRSPAYRSTLLDLPGYDPRRCGDAQNIKAMRP